MTLDRESHIYRAIDGHSEAIADLQGKVERLDGAESPLTKRLDGAMTEVLGRVGDLCERVDDLATAQSKTLLLVEEHITKSTLWRNKTDAELTGNAEGMQMVKNAIQAGRRTSRAVVWVVNITRTVVVWTASSVRTLVVWAGGLAAGAYAIWQIVVAWDNGGPGGGIGPAP